MPLRPPDEFGNALQARAHLALMHWQERTAVLAETTSVPATRAHFASLYRRLIGVDPSRRSRLRAALDVARGTGHGSVAELIDAVNAQASRSPPPASGAPSP